MSKEKEAIPEVKNVLIFVHGITPEANPPDPIKTQYQKLIKAVEAKCPGIFSRFDGAPIFVKWNALYQDPPPGKGDQRLDAAEKQASDLSTDQHSKAMPGNIWASQFRLPLLANLFDDLKYTVITMGLSDAIYYAAPDGETLVRTKVYGLLVKRIAPYLASNAEVRLHFVTHSLGVTIGHDFAYSIFNPEQKSSFADEIAKGATKTNFKVLQQAAKKGKLTLGSFVGMASQLPLLILRSQGIVDDFSLGKRLNPVNIGVLNQDQVIVRFFYDPDDILGFPSRALYEPNTAFQDIRVQTGWQPGSAHSNYWVNEDVAAYVAELWKRRT